MRFLNHVYYKYFVMLPVVFLILNALFFAYASREVRNTLFLEKYDEIVTSVDMLAAVEEKTDCEWFDHEKTIRDAAEFMDRYYQVFAGAYKFSDGNLVLISERFYETSPFEPLDYPVFIETVLSHENGNLVIRYTPENQEYRDLHIYFKWMPSFLPPQEQYLVAAGVSKYSITKTVSLWVSVGQWVSTAITFVINTLLIILIARLGHIYEQRNGDKWREEWGEKK